MKTIKLSYVPIHNADMIAIGGTLIGAQCSGGFAEKCK